MAGIDSLFSSSMFSRVSTPLATKVINSNISDLQNRIELLQQQIATGKRLISSSIDPVAAGRVLAAGNSIRLSDQFIRNLDRVISDFQIVDSSLGNANDLINKAHTIIASQSDALANAETRAASASEVDGLIRNFLTIANTQSSGKPIFGSDILSPLFEEAAGGIAYRGPLNAQRFEADSGLVMDATITADDAFGSVSVFEGLNGAGNPVDLNPSLTTTTKLDAVNAGNGISKGRFAINGTIIDVRDADTINDVFERINAVSGTTGVTASINAAQNGILLTGAAIAVTEVDSGSTARDLGILGTSAGTLVGQDINPELNEDTTVGSLLAGGLFLNGITISNQTSQQTLTANVVPTAAMTIREFIQAVEKSGTFVSMKISDAGTGLDLVQRLSGARMTVSENGGTTAAQLGLLYNFARAKLVDLNNGFGLGTVDGNDLNITLKDGTNIFVDVDRADTVSELVALLNNASPGKLSAAIGGSNNIVLTDTTGGAGNFSVFDMNGSQAATTLGIEGSTAGSALTGSTQAFVGIQVESAFSGLLQLRDGLANNKPDEITGSARLIGGSESKIVAARGKGGAVVNTFETLKSRFEKQKDMFQRVKSDSEDIDMAEAISNLQLELTTLQAALSTAAKVLQVNLFNFI